MSDVKNPFELMMAQAQEMAKAFNPALESFSPKGFEQLWPTMPKEFMEMSFGKGINKDGLDARTRLLLTLAGLTMLGAQSDTQIRVTVRHALEAGATPDEVAETIAMMSMFAGIPSMNRAMGFAREVLDDLEPKDDAE
ncbi:MAG: carboxymuconolactone decarboxylase family protein [Pseudomonadota bacterium]